MGVRPGYKQTEVGVIPEDWEVAPIAELVIVGPKNGYSGRSGKEARGTPTLSLGATTLGSMVLNEETVKRLDETIPTNSDLYLKPGDVLVQRSNTIDLVGTTAIFDGFAGVYVYPDLMMRMRFRDDATSHWFWRYANSANGRRFFVSVAAGSSGSMPKISGEKLRKMQLPLPPLPEQRAIAEALSDVDRLLAALDRLIAKKRDLKQAAMQQLLTGQTRLPGFHGDWEVKRLGDVITHCFSGATPRRNRPEFYQGDVRWITSGELNYNVITDTIEKISPEAVAETNLTIHPVGTFLMAITGLEAEGTRGSCGIVGAPSTTNQSCMAVYPKASLTGEYLFHYYVFRGKSLALQYCQGTKQQSYTASLVKQLPIELPPTVAEQTAIAEVLSDMDAELAALKQRRDKTRLLKQAMMQELLTGRIRLL